LATFAARAGRQALWRPARAVFERSRRTSGDVGLLVLDATLIGAMLSRGPSLTWIVTQAIAASVLRVGFTVRTLPGVFSA
jgi:hypothetical protein